MDVSSVVSILKNVGYFEANTSAEYLTKRQLYFVSWISEQKTEDEIYDLIELCIDGPQEVLDEIGRWRKEFLGGYKAIQPAIVSRGAPNNPIPVVIPETKQSYAAETMAVKPPSHVVEYDLSQTEDQPSVTKPVEDPMFGFRKEDVFPPNILYTYKTPSSHELVPRTFFGLSLFAANAGISLESFDPKVRKHFCKQLQTRLIEPDLIGVTLDPVFDATLFRGILKSIKGLKEEQFQLNDGAEVIRPGVLVSIDYEMLFDESAFKPQYVASPQFRERVTLSCQRIVQLRMSHTEMQTDIKRKFTPFFSDLAFNESKRSVEFVPTIILFEAFRNDTLMNILSVSLSKADGKIESIILMYIVSLPRVYSETRRDKSLSQPLYLSTILARVYPQIPQTKLFADKIRIRSVREGMMNLKAKGVLNFTIEGRGVRRSVYTDVVHYCESEPNEFTKRIQGSIHPHGEDSKKKTKTEAASTLFGYLEANPFPRHASAAFKLAFGERHVPRYDALIDATSDETLQKSFLKVTKVKMKTMRKYAELLGCESVLAALTSVEGIRSKKKKSKR